jgi:hypothetical protein
VLGLRRGGLWCSGLCCVGFAGLRVLGARSLRGRRALSNGGSIRPGRVPDFEICPTYVQGKISVGDPSQLESFLSQRTGASGPLCRRENSPSIHAKISKFKRKLARRDTECACTFILAGTVEVWYRGGRSCGRERTHLRGETGCLPDRCRAPQNAETPLHFSGVSGAWSCRGRRARSNGGSLRLGRVREGPHALATRGGVPA